MAQMGFYFNGQRCSGCKTCMVACKESHVQDGYDVFRRTVYEYTGGSWSGQTQDIFSYYLSVSCQHCLNPACVLACENHAISKKENGLVVIDQTKCQGSQACILACPYSTPRFDIETCTSVKCDGCYETVIRGGLPTCVAACPREALAFGPIDELRARYGSLADIAPLPSSERTSPSLVITPGRNYLCTCLTEGALSNLAEA